MPTIFILLGFRFYFFSNDHEPIHVHISKGGSEAKYNLIPNIQLVKNFGFKSSELKIIEALIDENKEIIIERWIAFFTE